ncbi:hypothetical protein QN360_19010, partial [Glaciimonas sp. CA11.2]|uniref:hypothetical protein n=1 Tax=Glaciimonas sp. CA11.2 TaxID=3048601 RepID=UPI002B233E46
MKITAPKDRQKVAQESVQDLALTAPATIIKKNRVGRPRLGTEAERLDLLLDAATTVFLEAVSYTHLTLPT